MEIKQYLQMLRRSWWVVLLTTLLAVLVALVASYVSKPMYQTSARFIVSPSVDLAVTRDVVDSLDTLDRRSIVNTYAEIFNSTSIYAETVKSLQLDPVALEDYIISVVVLPDTNILELSVSGGEPQTVALLANQIGQRAIGNINLLYRAYNITMHDPAVIPEIPYSPQPLRDLSLALVLGLVGGTTLAILSEQIRIPLETYRQRMRVDSETGVYNSRYFQRVVEDELLLGKNSSTSVGLVDLPGLQDYLDTLSPVSSQKLLKKITEILRLELRGNDIIGRWTATSFMVMLPRTPGSAAGLTFQRIQAALSEPIKLEQYDEVIQLEAVFGVATHDGNMTPHELIDYVKADLEKSRRSNTGPVSFAAGKS